MDSNGSRMQIACAAVPGRADTMEHGGRGEGGRVGGLVVLPNPGSKIFGIFLGYKIETP